MPNTLTLTMIGGGNYAEAGPSAGGGLELEGPTDSFLQLEDGAYLLLEE